MSREPSRSTEDVATLILLSRILRVGVAVAAALILIGTVLFLAARRSTIADYHVFGGEPTDLRGALGIWHAASDFKPRGIIQLGFLILVATPVARVAGAAFAFAHERDRLYAVIALAVLSALILSLFGPYR